MNERIRQLKEQAWTLVSNEEQDRGELYEAREQWERCDQKFAELIVQECVSIVAKRKDHAIDDGWNVDEAMSMAEMDLEEHFGVEE